MLGRVFGRNGRHTTAEPLPLAYEARGTGDEIIFLHGLTASNRWWAQNAPLIARHYRVYTVELPGFGDNRAHGSFDLDTTIHRLHRWMDDREIISATLVGHSLGGLLAARFAAHFPERVRGLILIDAAMLAFDPGLRRRALGLVRSLWWTPRRLMPMMAEDALRAHPRAVRQATRQLLTVDHRADLERIAAPTLIIWGDHDTIVPLTVGEQLRDRIPHARLVVIPGSSHTPMLDQPQAFNELLLAFMEELQTKERG